MFENKRFRQLKTQKSNRQKARQAIANHYNKQRLLCDKCGLCKLSVEEIKKNYDEILKKISVEK